jgi:glycosyltransferase involved in cell wall biosynthesis
MPLDVSIIIPTYNRRAQLFQALESLRAQKPAGQKFEVLVVDDGGQDGSFKALGALAKTWKPLRVFRQANAGPGVARNLGASKARSPVLAFLDDDAVAAPDWIAKSLAALRRHPEWNGFEGAVLPQEDRPASLFVHQVANTKGSQWLTCNLWVRRKDFLALQGFDPRYRWIREHTELAFRALDRGMQWPFLASSIVRHPALAIGWRRYFRDARDGQYEALLERSHPLRYREHLKWIDGRAVPVYYWAHYGSPLVALFSPALGLGGLALGVAATLYAWCRRRRLSPGGVLRLLPLALVIPYVRLYWVAWGYARYPRSPESA